MSYWRDTAAAQSHVPLNSKVGRYG